MGLLREQDLRVDVVRTAQGSFAEFWHTKVDTRLCVPLAEMPRAKLEFIWAIMKAITWDLGAAARLSPEAAECVRAAHSAGSTTLHEWLGGGDRDEILIALFELERRKEAVPRERLYANRRAMDDAAIRNYLLELDD